jgi:nucleoside-diphosphate-sugar epimerase
LDDPKQRRPDTSQAEKIIGWNPKIDLETGLGLTIQDFTRRINAVQK